MKNIMITYQSKTGITKKYAENIAGYLGSKNIQTKVASSQECSDGDIEKADGVLFGCWTHGLMILLQHPEAKWVKFAKELKPMDNKKIGLFTTYKLATGSMFKKMRKHLAGKINDVDIELKSKNGMLSDSDKALIDRFIQ